MFYGSIIGLMRPNYYVDLHGERDVPHITTRMIMQNSSVWISDWTKSQKL